MGNNEKTSKRMASLASKAMTKPGTLTNKEIKSIGAGLLTQAPDKKKNK